MGLGYCIGQNFVRYLYQTKAKNMKTIVTITYNNSNELKFKTTNQHMMHWIDEAEQALRISGVNTDNWQITGYQTI